MQNTTQSKHASNGTHSRAYRPQSVEESVTKINVARNERIASVAGGALLLVSALRANRLAGMFFTALGGYLVYRGSTGHCPVYETAGINTAVETNPAAVSVPHQQGIRVEKSVVINRPREEVFTFWRNFENLPRFMMHLEAVTMQGNNRSHWVAKAPLGMSVAWDAEVVNEVANEVIGWRSLAESQVPNSGSVRFADAANGRGTEVHVQIEYIPPAGPLGAAVARLFGEEPNQQVEADLQRLKQILEASQTPAAGGTLS